MLKQKAQQWSTQQVQAGRLQRWKLQTSQRERGGGGQKSERRASKDGGRWLSPHKSSTKAVWSSGAKGRAVLGKQSSKCLGKSSSHELSCPGFRQMFNAYTILATLDKYKPRARDAIFLVCKQSQG